MSDNLKDIMIKSRLHGIERILNKKDIIQAVPGEVNGNNGVLILVEGRIIWYRYKMMGYESKVFTLSSLHGVNRSSGLVYSVLEIHSGNDDLKVEKITKSWCDEFISALNEELGK